MTTQFKPAIEAAFHNWARTQPWWEIIGLAGRESARSIVYVPALPEALRAILPSIDGAMVGAVLQHKATGVRTLVVEDPLATSWYITIAAKDCEPVSVTGQHTQTPVGEA